MSKINLPELPTSPGSIYFEGDGLEPGELVDMYSGIQMRAYAEQAVRQVLAAQETRAWLIRERKNGTDPMFTVVTTTEPFESLYWPLAIIPESNYVEGADQQHP